MTESTLDRKYGSYKLTKTLMDFGFAKDFLLFFFTKRGTPLLLVKKDKQNYLKHNRLLRG